MHFEITHKEQGDGSDSWTITEWEDESKEVMTNRFMVYEDPGTAEIYVENLKYEQRQKDGNHAYLMLMAEFRLNNTPRSVNKNLENKLKTVRDELVNGQWITALEQLDEITPQGDLTQVIYDRIHLSIDTYIQDKF